MQKEKIDNSLISKYRGVLMGLSILLIMVFHYTEDCSEMDYHFHGWIQWFNQHIGSSSVDAFLFFSGLGLYYAMKKNPDLKNFYQRRITRLLIPYVLIAFPAWIIYDIGILKVGWVEMIKDFTFITFFSDGDKWFWYVGLMFLCYLIYPYIFRVVDTARDTIDGEIRLISLVSAITVVSMVIESCEATFFSNTNVALLRLPIFLAGCFYGRSSYEKRTSYWKWGVLLVCSGFLLTLLPTESPVFSRFTSGIFNVTVCAMLALFFSKVPLMPLQRVLEWFGQRSLELYLVHVAVRKLMKNEGMNTCHPRNELIMVVTAIVLTCLLHVIVQAMQKKILHSK